MASIYKQRVMQRAIIEQLLREGLKQEAKLLVVGVGDGRELETLLESEMIKTMLAEVVALDIEDWLTDEIAALPNLAEVASRLTFVLGRAEHLECLFEAEKFDIVQCGFVFHELPYGEAKEQATRGCFHVLKRGGFLVYSDMFLDNQLSNNPQREAARRQTIQRLYGQYLREADEALKEGRLTKEQWEMLCGDGIKPGLLKSMNDALSGEGDFYEPLGLCIDRLLNIGFVRLWVYPNCLNRSLYIIVGQKPTEEEEK
jgi:ubiquinone/menaquinone biosynthesis C-methylase UbiE